MPESRLELDDVGWSLQEAIRDGSPPILRGVSLALAPGEWVAVTGPSGGGKTTLLSLAAGLLRPIAGRVVWSGQNLAELSEAQLSRLRAATLGLVFQSFHLDDSRDALNNVLLPAYFSDRPWFELKERALQLARSLQLDEHLRKPVSVLSGGQKQRVAVARALLLGPQLILADEPTAALDRPTAELVLSLFDAEQRNGAAVMTVTHDRVVQERADRVLDLSEGQLRPRVAVS